MIACRDLNSSKQTIFDGADKDGNGRLDIKEFTAYLERMDDEVFMMRNGSTALSAAGGGGGGGAGAAAGPQSGGVGRGGGGGEVGDHGSVASASVAGNARTMSGQPHAQVRARVRVCVRTRGCSLAPLYAVCCVLHVSRALVDVRCSSRGPGVVREWVGRMGG